MASDEEGHEEHGLKRYLEEEDESDLFSNYH